MGNSELPAIFLDSVNDAFLRASVECLMGAYESTYAAAYGRYPAPEAHDALPIERRAVFEAKWRELARAHGLWAEAELNDAENCYHTTVRSGRVVLTASAVQFPRAVVRPAGFRRTLARSSELNLIYPTPPREPDAPLYAILQHGPDGIDPSRPAFVLAVFPDPYSRQNLDSVNVLARFPDLLSKVNTTEEIVPDSAKPTLRKRPAEEAQ